MKIFPANSKYILSSYDYWGFLNTSVLGLTNYIKQFKPGWVVLNDSTPTYSHEELIKQNIIKPMRILKRIDKDDNGNDLHIYEKALIVFPSNLKYNQGLINNFKGYDSVWIYYGDPQNTLPWGYEIPKEALPEEGAINIVKKARLLLQNKNTLPQIVLTALDGDITQGKLTFDPTTWTTDNLYLLYVTPTTGTIQLSTGYEIQKAPDGKLQKFYPSYYIFSSINKEGTDVFNLRNKDNYRLVRNASGGGYYTWTFIGAQALVEFQNNATDVLGLKYLLDIDYRQKRFYLSNPNITETQSIAYQSYTVIDGTPIFTIKAVGGGGWGGSNRLNHDFYNEYKSNLEGSIYGETIFIDEYRQISTESTKNNDVAIPQYGVYFANNLNEFETKIKLI